MSALSVEQLRQFRCEGLCAGSPHRSVGVAIHCTFNDELCGGWLARCRRSGTESRPGSLHRTLWPRPRAKGGDIAPAETRRGKRSPVPNTVRRSRHCAGRFGVEPVGPTALFWG